MSGDEFPETICAMKAFRDGDGGLVYSTALHQDREYRFYREGHPIVARLVRATYRLEKVEELPVDASPELRATWESRRYDLERAR